MMALIMRGIARMRAAVLEAGEANTSQLKETLNMLATSIESDSNRF